MRKTQEKQLKKSDVLIEMRALARENEENLEEQFLLVSADVAMLCRENCITWKTFLRFSRSNVSDVHVAAAYILLLSDRLQFVCFVLRNRAS